MTAEVYIAQCGSQGMQKACYNMDSGFERANTDYQRINITASADREMGYLWDLSCTE